MNKSLWFLLFTLSCGSLGAQQILLETGKVLSRFKYENSAGEAPENLRPETNSFFGVGFRTQVSDKLDRFHWLAGISYNQYSASGSDTTYGNYYQWDVNYLGVNIVMDYEFLKKREFIERKRGFAFYARAIASTEFLVLGTQTLNHQVYNLSGVEQFDRPFLFLRGGVGATYCVTKDLALFGQYAGGIGLPIKGPSEGEEKLQIVTHQFGIGVMISLGNCKYCYTNHNY